MKKIFLIPILVFALSLIVACSPQKNKDKDSVINYLDSFREDLNSNISVSILYKNSNIQDVDYAFESSEKNSWGTVYYMYPQDGYYLTNTISGDHLSKGKIYYVDGSYELIEESKTTYEEFVSKYYYQSFNLNSLDFSKSNLSKKDSLNEQVLYNFTFENTVNLNISYPEYKLNLKDIQVSFELIKDQEKLNKISLTAFDSILNQYIELIISNSIQ